MRPKIADTPYSVRFANRKPRIYIGLVAFGAIDPQIVISWTIWSMQIGKRYADKFEIYFGVAARREQYRARNYLVDQAREAGADFLLMIDDDHTVHDCPDMLDHFFNLEKPIQTAIGIQRGKENVYPTVLHVRPNGAAEFYTMAELPKEPSPVDASGGGCTWVDMWVFDFLASPFWWPFPDKETNVAFIPDTTYGLDIHFCIRAKKLLGLETWLNTNVSLGHLINEREIVRPQAVGMTDTDYAHREQWRGAYKEVADALCEAFEFVSVYDVGSAQGFLVDELLKRGRKVRGIECQKEAFRHMSAEAQACIEHGDATAPGAVCGQFDLVTCVEVAEHIEPHRSDALVQNLCDSAKRFIYFTADETPGRLHINARPHGWWIGAFAERGWVVDYDRTAMMRAALYGNQCNWLSPNSFVFKKDG
jgi:hypothetical protein